MDDHLAAARAALTRVFGYPDFRGRQAEGVQAALQGRDVLVLMPTGMGKSLIYSTGTGAIRHTARVGVGGRSPAA